eukprot:994652-Prymnesium_polylepis.1
MLLRRVAAAAAAAAAAVPAARVVGRPVGQLVVAHRVEQQLRQRGAEEPGGPEGDARVEAAPLGRGVDVA